MGVLINTDFILVIKGQNNGELVLGTDLNSKAIKISDPNSD